MPVKVVPNSAGPIFVARIKAWSGIAWIERTPYAPGHSGEFVQPVPNDACLWPETDYENIT
jgi:hypothetical protein